MASGHISSFSSSSVTDRVPRRFAGDTLCTGFAEKKSKSKVKKMGILFSNQIKKYSEKTTEDIFFQNIFSTFISRELDIH